MAEFWTPQGSTYIETEQLTPRGADRPRGEMHLFEFYSPRHNQGYIARVVTKPGESQARVEDMAACALESWLKDLYEEEHKRPPTQAEQNDIGRQLKEWREYQAKRRESTNGRIWYPQLG